MQSHGSRTEIRRAGVELGKLQAKHSNSARSRGFTSSSRYRPLNRQTFTRFRIFFRARMIHIAKYPFPDAGVGDYLGSDTAASIRESNSSTVISWMQNIFWVDVSPDIR